MAEKCGQTNTLDTDVGPLSVGPCVLPKGHNTLERHRDALDTTWPDQERVEAMRLMGQRVDNRPGTAKPYEPPK